MHQRDASASGLLISATTRHQQQCLFTTLLEAAIWRGEPVGDDVGITGDGILSQSYTDTMIRQQHSPLFHLIASSLEILVFVVIQ